MNLIDKQIFLKFFNNKGYVFNFSTSSFNQFSEQSIGIALTEKYGVSKGASLECFARESSDTLVIKIFSDLMNYYENTIFEISPDETEEQRKQFLKCKKIIEKYKTMNIPLELSAINSVSREYIIDISKRALKDIENNSFDSAITKSRTLLEEVFCFAIESQNENPTESGDIVKLYKQVKDLYNMHQDSETDKRINDLLSGFDKVITSISQMRNKSSDAHGVGNRRINIKDYHARLFVNSAMTLADFILSVVKNHNKEAHNAKNRFN